MDALEKVFVRDNPCLAYAKLSCATFGRGQTAAVVVDCPQTCDFTISTALGGASWVGLC
jgi:hypothetical protein